MKKLFIFSMLTLIFGQLSAQDLIVTKNGDSIQCKIATIKHNNIYYHTEVETLPKALPISDVGKYKHNYFRPQITDYHKWVFSINGGYSQRLAKTENGKYAKHNKKLKKGFHIGGDVAYYFSEHLGYGAKITVFKSSHSQDDAAPNGSYYYTTERNYNFPSINNYSTPNVIIGHRQFDKFTLKDEHSIYYVGPMFSTRFFDMGKGTYLINYSIGYLSYVDEGTDANGSFTIKGNTIGLSVDFGYDYWFSRNNALGVRLSLIGGSLKKYTYDNGKTKDEVNLDKNKYEGLGRMDISVGLRFGK